MEGRFWRKATSTETAMSEKCHYRGMAAKHRAADE
jgi:hypothetical protein